MIRLQFLSALVLVGGLCPVLGSPPQHQEGSHGWLSVDDHGSGGDWLGWGADIYNNRWASASAQVDASNVGSLHSTCVKEYDGGVSAAPLVVNGISYYPTWGGLLVALDYTKCKMLWQTNITKVIMDFKTVSDDILEVAAAVSRTTPAVEGNVLFIGTQANALLLAIDSYSGEVIDRMQINDHPLAIVTMSPTVWHGTVFVGGSSAEESAADSIPGYKCCSFIGNMQGIAFEHGHFSLLWNQNMVPVGSGFSGAAVWGAQPSIDPLRNQVFVATGNVYSLPPSYHTCRKQTKNSTVVSGVNVTDSCAPGVYQEAVLAFDVSTVESIGFTF